MYCNCVDTDVSIGYALRKGDQPQRHTCQLTIESVSAVTPSTRERLTGCPDCTAATALRLPRLVTNKCFRYAAGSRQGGTRLA